MVQGSRLVSPYTLSDFKSEFVGQEFHSPILPRVRGPTHSPFGRANPRAHAVPETLLVSRLVSLPTNSPLTLLSLCALRPTRRRTLELCQTGSDRTSTRGVEVRSVGISPCQRHCVPECFAEGLRRLICPPAATDLDWCD